MQPAPDQAPSAGRPDTGPARLTLPGRAAFAGRVPEQVLAAVALVGGYSLDELSPGSRPYEDLCFDSVMLLELKKQVEKRLPEVQEVSVPELLPVLSTLGELVAFYEQRAGVAAAAS